jgi:hypothetical protein
MTYSSYTEAIKERDRKILQGDIKIKSEEISPQYVDPGIGATRVIEDAWSTGYLYMDDEKYGIGDLIWDAVLTISGCQYILMLHRIIMMRLI